MRLSRVLISGFKTFAQRCEVVLDGRITAVVGPNGSGKSNFVDAIRWGLGETNARELRGARMDEVIHAGGGGGRGRMALAEVELILDNVDGELALEDAEVAIHRRVGRDGESEFRLNGERVRLRDLERLLAPTGLTQSGYSVVGQHDIDDIIQATPTRRRALVEQAAGVRHLRAAVDESLSRVGQAEATLRRLEDFLVEAEPRLAELAGQAEVAREQQGLAARLSELRGSLAREEWRAARARLRQARRRLEVAASRAEAADQAEAGFSAGLERQRQLVEEGRSVQARAAARLQAARLAAEHTAGEMRRWRDRRDLGAVQRRQAAAQLEAAVGELERAARQVEELVAASPAEPLAPQPGGREETARRLQAAAAERLEVAESRRAQAESALTTALDLRGGAVSAQREAISRRAGLEEAIAGLRREIEETQRRIERTLAGGADPAAALAEAVAAGRLRGRRLRSCLRARDGADAVAIEAALEAHLDAWLVDDPDAARALWTGSGTRESLLRPAEPEVAAEPVLGGSPLTGVRPALEAVEITDQRAVGAVGVLLRSVWLADGPGAAEAVARGGGVAVLADGTVVGRATVRGGGPPGRDRFLAAEPDRNRLEALEASLAARSEELTVAAAELDRVETERGAAEEGFLSARDRLEVLRQERSACRRELDAAAAELREAETELSRSRILVEDHRRRLELARAGAASAGERARLAELRLTAVEGEVLAALARLGRAAEVAATTEESVNGAEAELAAAAPGLAAAERRLAVLEAERSEVAVAVARAGDELAALRSEVAGAEATVAELAEVVRGDDADEGPEPDAQAAERAEREMVRLERRIAALGPVNALAPAELERLSLRAGAVRQNRDDLGGACADLRAMAAHLSERGERRFDEVFDRVDRHFQELFAELFPGGRASLRLEAPPSDPGPAEGLAEPSPAAAQPAPPGVQILAQPSGKRLQPLSLLSGGERALTALAVILAMQQVSPSPFYVFDEVDAALDDSNVQRFSRLLERLSQSQQFIIVTHNHITMAAADALYGVTIDRSGVSSLLGVRLESEAETRPSRRLVAVPQRTMEAAV